MSFMEILTGGDCVPLLSELESMVEMVMTHAAARTLL